MGKGLVEPAITLFVRSEMLLRPRLPLGRFRLAKSSLLRHRGYTSLPPSRTLYDKVWDDHVISNDDGGASLVFIDRHLVHEVGRMR